MMVRVSGDALARAYESSVRLSLGWRTDLTIEVRDRRHPALVIRSADLRAAAEVDFLWRTDGWAVVLNSRRELIRFPRAFPRGELSGFVHGLGLAAEVVDAFDLAEQRQRRRVAAARRLSRLRRRCASAWRDV